MKSLFIIFGVLAIFYTSSNSEDTERVPTVDIVEGILGPNDTELAYATSQHHPFPEVGNISRWLETLKGDNFVYTYISVIQRGSLYPDARVEMIAGGIGNNSFQVAIIPGPSKGWEYTLRGYGYEEEVETTTEFSTTELTTIEFNTTELTTTENTTALFN